MNTFNSINIQLFNTINAATIHIRVQQRNGRKCVTVVENLDKYNIDLKSIAKKFRETFHCSATVTEESKTVQMSGDHREGIKKLLVEKYSILDTNISIHGF